MSVFDSSPTTPLVVRADRRFWTRRSWLRWRSSPATAGGRWSRTAPICASSSSGRTTSDVLRSTATRTHIELYRAWMDERGLAPSTVDRRLSTVCGYYRFAHIDGRIPSNPAQYVRRPRVHPATQRGMDRGELASFLYTAERTSPMHAALAVLLGLNGLRVSEACGAEHRRPRLRTRPPHPADRRQGQQASRHPARSHEPPAPLDLAIGERSDGPILLRHDGQRLDTRTAYRWVRSIGKRAGLDRIHPHMLRAAFIMAALDAGVPLRDVQIAARHADPRTTTVYDRRRQNYDRHAAYAVVAFVTSG